MFIYKKLIQLNLMKNTEATPKELGMEINLTEALVITIP